MYACINERLVRSVGLEFRADLRGKTTPKYWRTPNFWDYLMMMFEATFIRYYRTAGILQENDKSLNHRQSSGEVQKYWRVWRIFRKLCLEPPPPQKKQPLRDGCIINCFISSISFENVANLLDRTGRELCLRQISESNLGVEWSWPFTSSSQKLVSFYAPWTVDH